MKYKVKKKHHNTPEEVLLDDLRKAARKLGKKSLTIAEYESLGSYDPSTFIWRFGAWNAAIELAGLKINRLNYIPPRELMQNLKCVWDKLGRQPKATDMKTAVSRYCLNVYSNRYGTWNNALDAFVRYIKTGAYKKADKVKRTLAAAKQYRRKKRRLKRMPISKGMRFDVLNRDHFKCRCGRSPATDPKIKLHIDHIKPLSKNGKTTIKNLQTLCSDCNIGKRTKTMNNEQ
jgi:hypothetical protein